jgi:hypothetical protein
LKWWAETKIKSTFIICLKFLGSIQISNCPTFFEHQDFQNAHEYLGINETFFNLYVVLKLSGSTKIPKCPKVSSIRIFPECPKFWGINGFFQPL